MARTMQTARGKDSFKRSPRISEALKKKNQKKYVKRVEEFTEKLNAMLARPRSYNTMYNTEEDDSPEAEHALAHVIKNFHYVISRAHVVSGRFRNVMVRIEEKKI